MSFAEFYPNGTRILDVQKILLPEFGNDIALADDGRVIRCQDNIKIKFTVLFSSADNDESKIESNVMTASNVVLRTNNYN